MTPGINTLLLSTGPLGPFTCSGMTLLIYMGPTALRGIRATEDKLSNVESQVFTPYKFGSTAGDRTPDLLTTRPTCYHSAMAMLPLGWAHRLLSQLAGRAGRWLPVKLGGRNSEACPAWLPEWAER